MRTLALALTLLAGGCGFDGVPAGGGPDTAPAPDLRPVTDGGTLDCAREGESCAEKSCCIIVECCEEECVDIDSRGPICVIHRN